MTRYKRFKAAVGHWVDALALRGWAVLVQEKKLGKRGALAQVTMSCTDRQAQIDWNTQASADGLSPEDVALHEVLHILFYPALCVAAQTKSADHALVVAEEHAMINVLMPLLRKARS